MPVNKSDTVVRLAVQTSVTADLSQYKQTLTSSGGGAYLSPSANTAIDGSSAGREITLRFVADTSSSGVLVYHGSTGGTVGFRVTVASGVLTFTQSGGDVTTFTPPGLSGTAAVYYVTICTRPNPLTTGASDAMVTEIVGYNETSTNFTIERVTHALGTISASDVFSFDGQWDGATLGSAYGDTIHVIRIGGRFKSTTESAIDWGHYTPSTPTAGENLPDSIPAFDADSDIGDGGVVAGPAYAIAGAMVGAAGRRMLSPLVNDLYINGAWQGWDRRCSTTIVSKYDVEMTSGASTANPGHGTGVSGTPEICRTFDSSNSQYFEYNGSPGFLGDLQGSDATLSCWIYCDSLSADMVVYGVTGGGGSSGALNDCAVLTVLSTSNLEFSWHAGSGSTALNVASSDGPITVSTWHHIAVTLIDDAGGNYDVAIYVDGVITDGTGTIAHPDLGTSSTWQVGRRDDNGTPSEYFDGSIQEIVIRGREMSSDEIASEAGRAQGHLYQGNPIDKDSTYAHFKLRRPSNGYMPARAFMDVGLGGDTYKAHLDTLTKRPVPLMAGRICGRVLAGVDSEGAADAVKVAIVATNRQPGKVTIGGPPAKTVYATGTITAGRDELLFSDLDIPRDADDCCWFYLASRINAGSPGDNTAIQMQGCQVIPYSKTLSSSYPLPFAAP